jgi:hypothetical protein
VELVVLDIIHGQLFLDHTMVDVLVVLDDKTHVRVVLTLGMLKLHVILEDMMNLQVVLEGGCDGHVVEAHGYNS